MAKSILIVEDEAVVAKDLERSLTDFGYDVLPPAKSSEEAILAVSRRHPDLALMDIQIKGPRDGVDTACLLLDRYDVRVVYLTGHADVSTIERVKVTQPLGYLVKPLQLDVLRGTLEVAFYRAEFERRRRQEEHVLDVALRNVNDAVVSTDTEGMITFVNPVAETLLGIRAAQAVGRPFREIIRIGGDLAGSSNDDIAMKSMREGRATTAEMALVTCGSTPRLVCCKAAPVVQGNGQRPGAVVVLHDVTEVRGMQTALEHSERLAAIGTLTAGVAHEVRSPLTCVIGNLDRAVQAVRHRFNGSLPTNGEEKSWLDEIAESIADARDGAARIRALVQDLHGLSRKNAPSDEIVDVRMCIDSAVRLVASDLRPVAAIVRCFEDVPSVRADSMRLVQVLVNLLVNAAHAMAETPRDNHELHLATKTLGGGDALVEIRDTGCGMSAEVLRHIFEPFFTTKDAGKGTGLGLSISREIVRSIGGRIEVESEPGNGATFRIILPAASALADVPLPSARTTRTSAEGSSELQASR